MQVQKMAQTGVRPANHTLATDTVKGFLEEESKTHKVLEKGTPKKLKLHKLLEKVVLSNHWDCFNRCLSGHAKIPVYWNGVTAENGLAYVHFMSRGCTGGEAMYVPVDALSKIVSVVPGAEKDLRFGEPSRVARCSA